jgi:hypothetical protein
MIATPSHTPGVAPGVGASPHPNQADVRRERPINIGHFTSVSFLTNTLIRNGGQGRNRTADTRIFSPRQSAPKSIQDHLKQPVVRKWPLGRFSWVLLGDAGLETKVETDNGSVCYRGLHLATGRDGEAAD